MASGHHRRAFFRRGQRVSATYDHQRHHGKWNSRVSFLLSSYRHELARKLRRHRITGRAFREYINGTDLGYTNRCRHFNRDTERDQLGRDRDLLFDGHDRCRCCSCDLEFYNGEWHGRVSFLLSNCRLELAYKLRRHRIAQWPFCERIDGTDRRYTDAEWQLQRGFKRYEQRRNWYLDSDNHDCRGADDY